MLLFLKHLISQSGNDEYAFFRAAYYWKFNKVCNSDTDVVQYRLHAIVPNYVREYVENIQKQRAKGGDSISQPT